MSERGALEKEVIEAIVNGETFSARHSRTAYRRNFQYNDKWGNKFYHIKQVVPIVKKENSKIIVITVFAFYF